MFKLVAVLTSAALVSTPVLAQALPDNCRPVFPLTEELAQVPGDVVADRAVPAAAQRRGFFGLPLLPLLLLGAGAAGGVAVLADGDGQQPASV